MKFALAQLNPTIGDLEGNAQRIIEACLFAYRSGAKLVLTPELSLLGYPPRDLLLNASLLSTQDNCLNKIAKKLSQEAKDLSLLVGIAEKTKDSHVPSLFNSIALIQENKWKVVARKQLLPTYDIFDEPRYFRASKESSFIDFQQGSERIRVGITICEDLWVEETLQEKRLSGPDPIAKFKEKEIDCLVNLSASPFLHSKELIRQRIAAKAAIRLNCPIIYVNQVGGNDELIFDGSSFVLNKEGEVEKTLPAFQESLVLWDLFSQEKAQLQIHTNPQEKLFKGLVLGVQDYARKCHFKSALIGLSGGIDSALVTTIATAALGAKRVHPILMPSPWSSAGSIDDAKSLANRLEIATKTIPISSLMNCFDLVLKDPLGGEPKGITAENLQSRIRGTLLMALANQHNHLLLSTGNKSELAVGYCTLYGDMNGGLSVIGDLYKTCVFNLCEWIDSHDSLRCREHFGLSKNNNLIGETIRLKPPSAELREGQLDSDSLPDYNILDPILKGLIEKHLSPEILIKNGYDSSVVKRVAGLLKASEFKRRQAPPLLKVSNQAFGTGWRKPIAS